jgi:polar amino acid transport system substrate-binding protein
MHIYLFCFVSLISCWSIQASSVLILGNQSLPFTGIVNDKPAGMTFEILQEMQKNSSITFEYVFGLPWQRAQLMLKKGENNLIAMVPFTRTEDREESYTWIAELFSYDTHLITYKRETPITVDEAKHLNVGVIRGSAHIPFLTKLGFTRLHKENNTEQLFKLLSSGYVDVVVESQFVDKYNWNLIGNMASELQFTNIGKTKHIYIAGNLEFPPEISTKIKIAIDQMRDDGRLQAILNKW